ncbi:hypothetical protein JCM9279_006311 [Rhodotorula babjevae]
MTAHPALQPGNVAVITGAGAGGIGFQVALHLARLDLHTVLLDNNQHALDLAAQQLVDEGISETRFTTRLVDVSDPQQLVDAADAVFSQHGRVDFLHLNAGVGGKSATYGKGMLEDWDRIFKVNLGGVTAGSAAFVERMVAQDSPALVVITGSKQGITMPPGTGGAYNASKAAVKAFAEVLAHDLRAASTKVDVKLLVPGWVYTKLSTGGDARRVTADAKPAGAWSAAQCAVELFSRLASAPDEFYIVCPDNETSTELDYARFAWSAGDVLERRTALSRWDPAYKDEYERFIKERVSDGQ